MLILNYGSQQNLNGQTTQPTKPYYPGDNIQKVYQNYEKKKSQTGGSKGTNKYQSTSKKSQGGISYLSGPFYN